jgi:hypothetical protein
MALGCNIQTVTHGRHGSQQLTSNQMVFTDESLPLSFSSTKNVTATDLHHLG